jgi:small conductance mechanosensitive channel
VTPPPPGLPFVMTQAVGQARSLLQLNPAVWSRLADRASDFAVNLAAAALILIGTIIIANWAARLTRRALDRVQKRRGADPTLRIFAASVVRYTVVIIGGMVVLQQLGVKTTSIIAAVGAASLAIGLAMQGALSNVAAGVMILVLRPFRVGDIVESIGRTGRVQAVDLFVTELATLDNIKIVIPNSKIFGDVIVNHSFHDLRRADTVFHLPLTTNVPALLNRLRDRLLADPRVLKDPPPLVEVTGMAEAWVEVAVRPWARRNDYGLLKADILLCARLLDADPDAQLPPPAAGPVTPPAPAEAAPLDSWEIQPIKTHLRHGQGRT